MVFQNTLLVLLMRFSRLSHQPAQASIAAGLKTMSPLTERGLSNTIQVGHAIENSVGETDNNIQKLYLTSTAVVMSELCKLIISLCGMWNEHSQSQYSSVSSSAGLFDVAGFFDFIHAEVFHIDTIKLMVPGLLYTVQNNLLFIALSNLEAAVYQVTYQLKILTTALFSVFLLNRKLTTLQMFSLLLLFCGVSLVQLAQLPDGKKDNEKPGSQEIDGNNQFLGLICVLLACCSSGFAGVYFEKILKKGRKVSLYVRNLQLSLFGVSLGLVLVFANDGKAVLQDGFFQGYDNYTWAVIFVQAGSGFVIASVIKYADNILKGFATAVSIILSAYLSTFIFNFTITFQFLVGTMVVVCSVFLYGYKPQKAKTDKIINILEVGKSP